MALPLNFYFKKSELKSKTVVVDSSTTNYISHVFVNCPIYNLAGTAIGYKVSDDYVQQVAAGKYIIRLNNTYHISGQGSISWTYVFENTKAEVFYPINQVAASNITFTTGNYYGKTGSVSLFPKSDGTRQVNITFN